MYDLSKMTLLSFEIGDDCNLRHEHSACPINRRKYANPHHHLDVDTVVDAICTAQELNFKGAIAFHYYNEPLLHTDVVLSIMRRVPKANYLLWTNGLLLNREPEKNVFLNLFQRVCITCYDPRDMPFFLALKGMYRNISIFDWELDDRLQIYDSTYINELSCKRPLSELPIDYCGNIHLCCMDWNNEYEIGNIFMTPLREIIEGGAYQSLMEMCMGRLLEVEKCPPLCRQCRFAWISYPKYDVLGHEGG